MVCRCVLVGALVVTTIPTALAQVGKMCGTVQDQSGAVVLGAELELKAPGARLAAKTGTRGEFCFDHIEPGEYELSAQAHGFERDLRKISLRAGQSAGLTISLT
jgi:hypothetical protein